MKESTGDFMSKDDAEVLHSWQRTQQSTAVSTAFTLGQFFVHSATGHALPQGYGKASL